jgi:hypothetical protein
MMGILSIFLGIFGIIFGWFPVIQYVALALSILGIIFSALALKKASVSESGKGKGPAIAGLVLCVIAAVCSGIGVIACTVCAAGAAGAAAKTPGALQDLQNAANALQETKDALENLTK